MALGETLSVLAGVGGLGFGAYQYYRARSDKKRKKELNDLAEELNKLRGNIERIIETFESPTSKVDLSNQLDYCAKDVLAYRHETGNAALVKPANWGDDTGISNAGQALDLYKQGGNKPRYHLSLESEYTGYESDLVYAINEHGYSISKIYEILEKVQEEHKGTLEEFSPGLYQEAENLIDDFVRGIYSEMLHSSEGVEINPDDYNGIKQISKFLFEYFWYYEGIEGDLEKLSELAEKIETTRTTILQASY